MIIEAQPLDEIDKKVAVIRPMAASDIATTFVCEFAQPAKMAAFSGQNVSSALGPNISNALVVEIPASSPLHKLQFLKKGWDGFHADPLSPQTLSTAQGFWSTLERSIKGCPEWLPTVEAGAGDFVEFAWSQNNKELQIWLYGEPDLRAEWFSSEAKPNEGEAYALSELIGIVREYLSA